MTYEEAQKKMKETTKKIKAYEYALTLSRWDNATLAPKKGRMVSSELASVLYGEYYSLKVSEEYKEILDTLENNTDRLTKVHKREIEVIKEQMLELEKIPKKDMSAYQETIAKAGLIWEEAKSENDFLKFAPYIERIFSYKKEFVKLTHPELEPYDACINAYEPKMTTKHLDMFFEKIKKTTIPLIKRISEDGREINKNLTGKKYSKKKQEIFAKKILDLVGFDSQAGLLATSEHPVTSSLNSGDVRMTTHYYEENLTSSIFSTFHESGHGIYNQNIYKSDLIKESLLTTGASNGIHESQSRFYENVIGRNKYLWEYLYPTLQKIFFNELGSISVEEFYREINIMKPGPIRIEADELTYDLHIIIRYEIERDMMEGRINIKDLPEIWNDKYEKYLGINPENDSKGVLQDVHWSSGLIGYFPSYSLGTAYSLQLANTMERSININELCRKGELIIIKDWLNENIHKHGKNKTPEELIKESTGEELNPKYHIDYLRKKFEKIYF